MKWTTAAWVLDWPRLIVADNVGCGLQRPGIGCECIQSLFSSISQTW